MCIEQVIDLVHVQSCYDFILSHASVYVDGGEHGSEHAWLYAVDDLYDAVLGWAGIRPWFLVPGVPPWNTATQLRPP